MSFEIKLENSNGMFHVKLTREVPGNEVMQLAQLATNIIGKSESQTPVYGPQLPNPNDLINYIHQDNSVSSSASAGFVQSKLGQRPVGTIQLGSYVEPKEGVRLKILSFPPTGRMKAVKALRELTGISIIGCKEIIFGNYPCPIITEEVAATMMDVLKLNEIHAKVVPADNNNLAA